MGHPGGSAADGLASQFSSAPSDIAELYDGWAGGYDDDVESWGYQVPDLLTAQLADVDRDALVLDAGCGTGRAGVALRAAGFGHIVGVDYSRASLDMAREREVDGEVVYESLAHLDLTKPLPMADDSFDAVLSAGVFTYLPDVASVVAELGRVCRPGGRVVFSQRTDLWESRSCEAALESVRAQFATLAWSDPKPYLPGHPEYGSDINIRIVDIIV